MLCLPRRALVFCAPATDRPVDWRQLDRYHHDGSDDAGGVDGDGVDSPQWRLCELLLPGLSARPVRSVLQAEQQPHHVPLHWGGRSNPSLGRTRKSLSSQLSPSCLGSNQTKLSVHPGWPDTGWTLQTFQISASQSEIPVFSWSSYRWVMRS